MATIWRWDTGHFTFDDGTHHTMDGWHDDVTDVTVAVTGLEATGSIGSPFIISSHCPNQVPGWTEIIPTESPGWTEVAPTDASGWTEVTPTESPDWGCGSISN